MEVPHSAHAHQLSKNRESYVGEFLMLLRYLEKIIISNNEEALYFIAVTF